MNPADNMEQRIRELRYQTGPETDKRILQDALTALEQTHTTKPQTTRPSVWRIIMTNRWTKVVPAAAAIIAIAVVAVTMLNKSAAKAYALEQTEEATNQIRFVHIRIEPAGKGLGEAWAQFGEDGTLLYLRMDFPDTEDGPKTTVWQADKATVWLKKKNAVVVVQEPNILAQLRDAANIFDPHTWVAELLLARDEGKCTSETVTTADGEMIKLSGPLTSKGQTVFYVDPSTKLLHSFEDYRLVNEELVLRMRLDYLSYDQGSDADVFTLNPPADAMFIDQTAQEIGLPKGDLTNDQIAMKVAREFFEAVIADDYAKAGSLYEGIPSEKLEEAFRNVGKIVRLVSVGTPTPHPNPATKFLQVPCQVEIEVNGQRKIETITPLIRPVYNQPDRWGISGGI